jgi:hypothetical protein
MEKRLRLSVLSLQGLLEFRLIEIEASDGVSPSLGVDLFQWIRIYKKLFLLVIIAYIACRQQRAEKPAFSHLPFPEA